MRSAMWFISFCVLIILVMSDGKGAKESDPNQLCPRIEDIEGNCKVDGPKVCMNYMAETYKEKYINCTCDNIIMLHKIKRYCKCNIRCVDLLPSGR
ncbi:unnamed protein product [Brassica rapa]|uniref:Uncharacterized protein n=2 Tax=Brassica TaxID=3705 RepID=A0A8D9LTP8_BRACM|nr:unnamed protein product [Brassica napus]CAG7886478.1 unnamed protein product [Brassica rapa]